MTTNQDRQDAFDRQARARYHHAASTLSPALQGRLRAARRTALAGDAGRREADRRQWSALPLAAVAAAVFALAIGLRWQRGADNGPMPPPGTSGPPAVAVQTVADPGNPQLDAGTQDVPETGAPDTAVPDADASGAPDTAVTDVDVPDTDAGVPNPIAPDPAAIERVAMEPQAPDDSGSSLSAEVDPALLVLDEDPDFYLWLGGDDALPASLEPPHDAT